MAFAATNIDLNTAVGGKSYPVQATNKAHGPDNKPSPAYSNVFIPAIWSGRLIEKFYDASVLPAISNTDYESEIKNFGDKVIIRSRPSLNINDYKAYAKLQYETPSSNTTTLSIDQGKYFAATMDDVMEVQSDINLMNEWALDASQQMKIAIDRAILGGLLADYNTAINYYDTPDDGWDKAKNLGAVGTGLTGDNIRIGASAAGKGAFVSSKATGTGAGDSTGNAMSIIDYIINMGEVLDLNNCPEEQRKLVLPTKAISLIKKSELRDASLTGDGTSMLRNGRIGMIDRFEIYASNLLPLETGQPMAIACTPQALTFASQMTKMETLRSQDTFGSLMRGLQVYGSKIVNPRLMTLGFINIE